MQTQGPPQARTQPPSPSQAPGAAPPGDVWPAAAALYVPVSERSHPPALLATIAVLIVLTFAGAAAAIILAITSSDDAQLGSKTTTTTVTVLSNVR